MAYIHYDQKGNGATYASVYESYRDKGTVRTKRIENLGRVIDRENGIFRQKGVTFQFTVESGRTPLAEPVQSGSATPESEKLILDFGDSWFLREYLSLQPFYPSIANALPDGNDTLLALIFYRLLANGSSSCHAKIWHEGNYSCLAFPHADLTGQNISRVLKELGREDTQRRFFGEYMSRNYGNGEAAGILIDSTGVPNATKMDVT